MVGLVCRRQALSHILRTASSIPSSRRLQGPQIWNRVSKAGPSSRIARSFSSFPSVSQRAAPAQPSDDDGGQSSQVTKFQELADRGIISPKVISTIVNRMGIHTMTDVQRMTINECLDGADLVAQAKTGTGKTIAFLMPIVQRILQDPNLENPRRDFARADDIRALIISPTRELAEQIAVEAKKIVSGTAVKVQTAVGGTQKSYHLRMMQREGCHILVGTPGRVKDILSDSYSGVSLDKIETFVLDEADRLLDIGFAPEIEEIQTYMPSRDVRSRQTLMFSATVPREVVALVRATLRPDFKFVRTTPAGETPTHEKVPQYLSWLRGLENQLPALVELAQREIDANKQDPDKAPPFKAIVYMNSTSEVALAHEIISNMKLPGESNRRQMFGPHPLEPCAVIEMHSRLGQGDRTRNSSIFRNSKSAILLSSDVTARGMDFPNVSHIIQLGLPRSTEDYIHRIGRTGRAGKTGQGWLMLQQDEEPGFRRFLGGSEFKIAPDDSLRTASLDLGTPAQLPAHVAKILQMVESGVRGTSDHSKEKAYLSMIGSLSQGGGREKQSIVNMLNALAKYGWGMPIPPPISPNLAQKLSFHRTRGLNIQETRSRSRDVDGRPDGFGRSSNRSSWGRSDRGRDRSTARW